MMLKNGPSISNISVSNLLIGAALAFLAACGQADSAADTAAAPATPVAATPDSKTVTESIQSQMLPAIEKTFSRRNAQVRQEAKVVHVRMDGDATGNMAGWQDCRVLTQLVRDTESVVLEFPNGKIDCTELLTSN